jgi:glycerol-3-phosphate dehydrogenase
MSGDKNLEIYPNPTALELAASMKNVAAFAGGIVLGILKKNGALDIDSDGRFRITKRVEISHGEHRASLDTHSLHRLVQFASREIVNVVKSEGGGKGGQLMMAGNHDLNLTVNSLTSRNVQAGMRLACGENIYEILTNRDAQGHTLTAEGVFAAHAMARRIQNNTASEAYAPLVFAVRNILMNRSTPEKIMAHYFSQTKQWTLSDAQKVLNGQSKPLGLRIHDELNASGSAN